MGLKKRAIDDRAFSGPKRMKVSHTALETEESLNAPSTSNAPTVPTASTSSSRPSNDEEKVDQMDLEMEDDISQQFRFCLIGYMPNPAVLQSRLCEEWNILNTSRRWDIADYKEQKFICLEISEDLKTAEKRYMKKAVDLRENSAMVVVGPISTNIEYLNLTEKPIGESNVRRPSLLRGEQT